ncbi:uncharacterized protein LOC116827407 [Chelonoidis abingdonii]|uniref:uncharacterized protein LOC116827407 n=1 Tax=Chelonoidis abingdonii TaxID=106734 RepID=UPI003F494FB0
MAEAKPYIVLKVVYKSKGKDSLTLGWQMVDVFQQETTNIRAIWTPKEFSTVVPLHPEKLPYNIMDYTLKHVSNVTLDHLEGWYVERLVEKRHSRPEHFPKYINIHHAVRCRQKAGIWIKIKQAFGLKAGGCYVNVLARVLKGAGSMHLPELPQQWAGEEKFLTSQLDFTSLQRSPRWTDPSVVLHPYLDHHSVLLIQIFGLNAIYVPDPSGQKPGKVISHPGQILELNTQSHLGWTTVPLFDSDYVRSGVHGAPSFQGSPSAEFLQSVISLPVKDVMAEGIKKKTLKLLPTFGSVTLEFWDGHYFEEEDYELPVNSSLYDGN